MYSASWRKLDLAAEENRRQMDAAFMWDREHRASYVASEFAPTVILHFSVTRRGLTKLYSTAHHPTTASDISSSTSVCLSVCVCFDHRWRRITMQCDTMRALAFVGGADAILHGECTAQLHRCFRLSFVRYHALQFALLHFGRLDCNACHLTG